MKERLGEINKNKFGTEMKIIAYRKSNDIDVQFLDKDGYIFKHQIYANFKSGGIKNPYDKNICGVGYMGVGKYHCKHTNGVHTIEYQNWIAMIRRCYDEKRKDTYSSYYGTCEVCSEWHNFQVFGQWYEQNFYQVGTERMHIDKDILIHGNKIYSPETCIIVPQRINMMFMNKPNKYNLPSGITPIANGRYNASYRGKSIGNYDTLELAVLAHDIEKKKALKELAEEYNNKIPNKLYEALINWQPNYKICVWIGGMIMDSLDYLGGALENFYEGDIENPHLIPRDITVKENGSIIASGTAAEIKDSLKDKYDRKIINWDAYFHMVTLTI